MSDETKPTGARALLWNARKGLLSSHAWLDYVRGVYSIDPGRHPFLTYVGINFTKTTIKNFKFYFSFFRRLSDDEIAKLLPVADRSHFDRFYEQWHPTFRYATIHRGTTFALKVDGDGTLTHYYHLRVRGLPFGPPERLSLSEVDRDNHHGVCEEFQGDRAHLKRYFYCRDPAVIAQSLELAELDDLKDELGSIDWLEYIESDGRDKMDWITASPRLIRTLMLRRGPPRLDSALGRIRLDCGFEMFGPGSARDGTDHSLYFIQPTGRASAGGYLFDGVRCFVTDHLGLDLLPEETT